MEELFEFEVRKKDSAISDLYIKQFIENVLDKHSLFWGGGYDLNKIQGVISTDEDRVINIDLIIIEFINYFSKQDEIIIKVYSKWFNKIASDILINRRNVVLTKAEDVDLI